MLGELIDLISGIAMAEPGHKAKNILGRVSRPDPTGPRVSMRISDRDKIRGGNKNE
jgi:hypothetical protein